MKEGLKLVLLLFDRAETKSKKKHLIHFFSFLIWAALDSAARWPQTNGMVIFVVKQQQQQQQVVVRTAQGYT